MLPSLWSELTLSSMLKLRTVVSLSCKSITHIIPTGFTVSVIKIEEHQSHQHQARYCMRPSCQGSFQYPTMSDPGSTESHHNPANSVIPGSQNARPATTDPPPSQQKPAA